ncbi:MAG: hypothetical protein WA973_00580 [Mesorhizobium sp.]
MPSYIPEVCFGSVRDANGHWTGKTGLISWPAHLRPRKPAPLPDLDLKALFGEADLPRLAMANGVFFLTLATDDRAGIAYTIERLINMLDAMDGDCDLEEAGDDEPTLGWPAGGPSQFGFNPQMRLDDDREQDEADYEDGADDEPSLGETGIYLTSGIVCDLEADRADNEPSLGWTDDIDQLRAMAGDAFSYDCEFDAGDLDIPGFIAGGNEAVEAQP